MLAGDSEADDVPIHGIDQFRPLENLVLEGAFMPKELSLLFHQVVLSAFTFSLFYFQWEPGKCSSPP